MTYQSGGYGQQPDAGQDSSGQATGAQYGQSYPQQGQQGYANQGGSAQQGYQQQGYQQGYPQQGYGQQGYGQQGYGYAQPTPSAGLPPFTPLVVSAAIGVLGLVALFGGFGSVVDGLDLEVWNAQFVGPQALLVFTGLLAFLSLVPNIDFRPAPIAVAASVTGAFLTIFQVSTIDGDLGAGAYILLIVGILIALLSVFWLVIDAGLVKVAPAAPATAAVAQPAATPQQVGYSAAAAAPAAGVQAGGYGQASGYGDAYGSSQAGGYSAATATPQESASSAGESATEAQASTGGSYASPSYAPGSYGSYGQPSYGQAAASYPSAGESAGASGSAGAGAAPSGYAGGASASAGEASVADSESKTTVHKIPEPPQGN
ncbi:DUF5336 domain-containing protein [Gordonia sp. ABSL1-1]|uniref:DUF5336 domain-containing protein n=1 Tax=Gordonia sp. ABSL1-1 TaxID=3053923 RepID=UPI0025748DA4|nr:DUF5336 domain-containing protein [Gordonia sp. ABSL1-1]MDL9937955.1 DUF5336 domain-containing protein [Gordonia sp. ABSL1-1]